LKIKKEVFHIQKLTELEKIANENPNSFWKTLETMDDNTDNTTFKTGIFFPINGVKV
jgi:Na+-transporting NADH:ubiquinone oxidoreductase subunit NqrF